MKLTGPIKATSANDFTDLASTVVKQWLQDHQIPMEIRNYIWSYIYESKSQIQRYRSRWRLSYQKTVVILNYINDEWSPVLAYNFDTPCWYCNHPGHDLSLCLRYYHQLDKVWNLIYRESK